MTLSLAHRWGDYLDACGRIAVCVIMIFISTPSFATDLDWDWDVNRYKAVKHHKHRHAKPRVIRLYASPRIEDDGWKCLDRIHVVGSQWATDAGAEDSAKKAFMEETRWRHGEAFMSIENARDYEKRCSRSSVGEVLNQTLIRCEIAARPCRPPFKNEGDK